MVVDLTAVWRAQCFGTIMYILLHGYVHRLLHFGLSTINMPGQSYVKTSPSESTQSHLYLECCLIFKLIKNLVCVCYHLGLMQLFLTFFYMSYPFIKQYYQIYPKYTQWCSFIKITKLTSFYSLK